MTEIDTVYIHHEGIAAESRVPPATVPGWVGQGWMPGRLPGAADAEESAAQAETDAAAAAIAAAEAATAQADAARITPPTDISPLVTEQAQPQIAGRRDGAVVPSNPNSPTGDTNPTTPEEG